MEFKNIAQAKKETNLSYLGTINSNAKTIKNKKVGNYTYILYLSPYNTSGYNVCPYSTPECRLGCLSNSGRVKIETYTGKNMIKKARVKKTKLFFEERDFFMNWLIAEIKAYKAKAKKDGYYFSVRLNGTSDIDWTEIKVNGKTVFEIFPDVQFYDYTKNFGMFQKELPLNYHLTFSYSGRNLLDSLKVLDRGYNVAVVFSDSNFPEKWNGYPVINGDFTDYRPNDGNGVIVGLKYKNVADKRINKWMMQSCFIVKTDNVHEHKEITVNNY